jgi:hypothetical protein
MNSVEFLHRVARVPLTKKYSGFLFVDPEGGAGWSLLRKTGSVQFICSGDHEKPYNHGKRTVDDV